MNYLTSKKLDATIKNGFTLIELLVTVSILGIASLIALPALSEFLVKTRAENEALELQRFILTARNTAINSSMQITICPLDGDTCVDDWSRKLSMFTNTAAPTVYNNANETLVKVKDKIKDDDKLSFDGGASLTYSPTGRLVNGANVSFTYCPKGHDNLAKGVSVSLSGRAYITQDTDNDNKDEDRAGNELNC